MYFNAVLAAVFLASSYVFPVFKQIMTGLAIAIFQVISTSQTSF